MLSVSSKPIVDALNCEQSHPLTSTYFQSLPVIINVFKALKELKSFDLDTPQPHDFSVNKEIWDKFDFARKQLLDQLEDVTSKAKGQAELNASTGLNSFNLFITRLNEIKSLDSTPANELSKSVKKQTPKGTEAGPPSTPSFSNVTLTNKPLTPPQSPMPLPFASTAKKPLIPVPTQASIPSSIPLPPAHVPPPPPPPPIKVGLPPPLHKIKEPVEVSAPIETAAPAKVKQKEIKFAEESVVPPQPKSHWVRNLLIAGGATTFVGFVTGITLMFVFPHLAIVGLVLLLLGIGLMAGGLIKHTLDAKSQHHELKS